METGNLEFWILRPEDQYMYMWVHLKESKFPYSLIVFSSHNGGIKKWPYLPPEVKLAGMYVHSFKGEREKERERERDGLIGLFKVLGHLPIKCFL